MKDVVTNEASTSAAGPAGIEGMIPDHRLLRRIGRGSYGEVWLARSVTGIWRAVKIVRREAFAEDRPFEREFEGIRTFQAVARGHEALIDVLHVGRPVEGGFYYYVMELADDVQRGTDVVPEFYEPKTLTAELKLQGRLSCDRCLRLAQELARALVHLHAAGLIHRDIKPANIVSVNGSCRLADLGLVAEAGGSRSFVGTEGFVPPEGPGTPQADVYALGKVLYEALTGLDRKEFPRLPLEWNGWPDARARLELNAVILQACDESPQRRYAGAQELLEHLELLQGGRSVRRLQHLERGWRWVRIGLVAALAVAGLGWAGAAAFRRQAARERALRQAAEGAREEAREQLAAAVTARLRGAVSSTRAGERIAALGLLREQRGLTATAELREALAGVLTRGDFRRERSFPERPRSSFRVMLDLPHERWFEGPVAGALVLRRLADGGELARLAVPGGLGPRWRVTVSPDGRWVALTRVGEPLWVADLTTAPVAWRQIGPAPGGADLSPDAEPQRVSFWPDGRELLCGGEGGEFQRVPLDGGVGRSLKLPAVTLPAIRPDGTVLACLDAQGRLSLCDAVTAAVVTTAEAGGQPGCLAWSPDGGLLATAGGAGTIDVWEWRGGQLARVRQLEGPPGQWQTVAFLAGGDLLMASGWAGWTCLWSVASGQLLSRDPTAGGELTSDATGERVGHHEWNCQSATVYRVQKPVGWIPLMAGGTRPVTTAFSPDGAALVVGSDEGLEAWQAPWRPGQGSMARESSPQVRGARSLIFSPQGDRVAVMGAGAEPVWHRQDAGWRLETGRGAWGEMKDVAMTLDRSQAAGARGDSVLVFERGAEGWQRRTSLPLAQPEVDPGQDWIQVDLSADGRWAAAGSFYTRRWWLWDTRSRELLKSGDSSPGTVASFSPDNRWLAIAEGAASRVLAAPDWQEVAGWARPGVQVRGFPVWRPDGRWLAVPRGSHELTIREAGSWRERVTLATGSGQSLREACFSPDGRYLAAPDTGGCVQVWDFVALEQAMGAALGDIEGAD